MTQKEILQQLVQNISEEQASKILKVFYIFNDFPEEDENLSQEELDAIALFEQGNMIFESAESVYKELGI